MATDRLAAALAQLEAERSSVVAEIAVLERKRDSHLSQLKRLEDAISSLRDLLSGAELAADTEGGSAEVVPPLPDVPPGPSRLLPYLTPGKDEGDKGSLQSAHMVAAVLDRIGEPVSRDKLQTAFFDFFGEEVLGIYWSQPIKAFRSALSRAVERDIINEVELPDGGGTVYLGGWRISQ